MTQRYSETHDWDNDGELILTGSANAYVAATARQITGYYQGLRICGKANHTNSGASTLNVNGIGALAIRKGVTTPLASGDIIAGKYYDFIFDNSNTVFQLMEGGTSGGGGGIAAVVDDPSPQLGGDLDPNGFEIIGYLTEAEAAAAYQPLSAGYQDLTEIAEPASPASNVARLYARDVSTRTELAFKNSSGHIIDLLRGVVSITDFGGSAAAADNSAALAAAFAALSGTGGTIEFPTGRFVFTSAPTLTLPAGLFSVTLKGKGADSTVLHWASGSGLTIACSNARHSVHVRDLSITTGTTNAGTGLKLTNSVLLGAIQQSYVTNVTVRGDDGGSATNYWTNGIEVIGLSQINFDGCLFYGASSGNVGVGLSVTGNAATSPNYGIVYNIDKCTFYSLGTGFNYGSYIQGVTISQCNFVNGVTGILQPTSAIGFAQLAVTNTNFDCTGNNVLLQSPVTATLFANCLFYIPTNGTGIAFTSTGFGNTFTGNLFAGEAASSSTTGILVSGAVSSSVVTGNMFYNLTTGVNLGGTSTWTVGPNSFESVTTPIANIGTNRHGPMFDIGAGGSVTQLTSKSATVSLNARCGQIVMHNASLAAGATVTIAFFTNSFITATSLLLIDNSASVGTGGAYRVQVRRQGAGSAQIDVTNITGGALAEAIVLNFAIIPIVTS